jgi:hypothetical protein
MPQKSSYQIFIMKAYSDIELIKNLETRSASHYKSLNVSNFTIDPQGSMN